MALKEGKVTLCYPNYTDESTLVGGSWESTLPLENLQTPYFSEVARTTDTDNSSTKFQMTLGRFRPIHMIALANHNLSAAAEWRIKLYNQQGDLLFHDSGVLSVWPQVYATSELEWEYDNFWLGTIEESDRESFTSLATYFFPESYVATYVEVEIFNEGNPDGYVSIGRLMVADAWQSERTASFGIQYSYDIGTTFDTAIDEVMTEYADVKTPKRTVQFDLATLTQEEGFSKMLGLNRQQGLHGEVLYTEFAEMDNTTFAKTFIARQQSVSGLSHPYYRNYSTQMSLKEIL